MLSMSILIIILAMSLSKEINTISYCRISAITLIYAGALTFNALHIHTIGSGIGIFCGLFQVSNSILFIELFLYAVASLILLTWPKLFTFDWNNQTFQSSSILTVKESRANSLLSLFSVLGGSFLISSNDFLSMYLSLELQSFALYILAGSYRDRSSASSAGLKYFLLGGLSSSLILLGLGLIYYLTGLSNFDSLFSFISVCLTVQNNTTSVLYPDNLLNLNLGLSLGLIVIGVGFLFKIAAAPFHNWAPDVYDDSPSNVTIWLSIVPKISLCVFLLEFYGNILVSKSLTSLVLALDWLNPFAWHLHSPSILLQYVFLVTSLLSLLIGTVLGLYQRRIKRLLAFSTISHMGLLLLCLAINTEESTLAFLFYLIQYTITNLNTFSIVLAFGYKIKSMHKAQSINPDIEEISTLKGQFRLEPILALSLCLCLFSMAGVPPLIGFFGKQSIFLSAMSTGHIFMALCIVVTSVISASYYLSIIKSLLAIEPLHDLTKDRESPQNVAKEKIFTTREQQEIFYLKDHLASSAKELVPAKTENEISGPGTRLEVSATVKVIEKYYLDLKKNSLTAIKNMERSSSISEIVMLRLSNVHAFIISLLSLLILLFMIKPSVILNSVLLCTLNIFYL